MGEEYIVMDGAVVSYDGLFKVHDLLTEINEFLTKKDYEKAEKKHSEKVTQKGKNVIMEMEYSHMRSDYIIYIIEVKIQIKNMVNVMVTKGARKIKYNEAELEVEIKSKIKTDLAGKWQSKPLYVFTGHVINKYLYPIYISKEINELKYHSNHLRELVKSFLNLYKF